MDNNGAGQFRRATGKVAMVGGDASAGYQQGYYQPPLQQQQQYSGTYQQHASRADNYSAMTVPYNSRMPAQQPAQVPPQAGYYHTIRPAHVQPQQHQQPRQDSASAQSYYQQTISGTAHSGYAHSGSGDMANMHGDRKQPCQQPASLDSQHHPMADSAVHSSAYVGQPNHVDEAAMANSFQQMGIGARHTPLAPRQHLSAEAQRKREQALEDAYDEDDGYAGNDIDVTLFPSNASQVVSTMRAGSAVSSRPSSSRNAGKSLENSMSSSPLDSRSATMRIKKCTSLYAPATGARIAAGSAQPLEPLQLPSRQTHRSLWTGVSRSNTSAASSTAAASPGDKPRRIQRRQSADTGAPISGHIDRRHSYAHLNTLASTPTLSPLPPHWRRCCRNYSTTSNRRHISTIPESPFPVARPYAHSPSGTRPLTSRNASGHAPSMPAEFAANQRFNSSIASSGASTNTNSPALGARPYAQGNGFDSSSDHLYPNARNLPPPQQQHPTQGVPVNVSSHLVEPSAPPLQYGEHQQMQGQVNLNPPYGGGRVYGTAAAAANSNYSHSSNGDGMSLNDPLLQPPSTMRPWTASSRSLPLAAPSPQFAERERPSSSASSGNGLPPMGAHPSANAAPANPPKAPAPTLASLEAYRTSIKRSNDPAAQLDFAKYVLEHARGIADNEANPKLAKKRYELLTEEGLKWVRKLAGSGITVHRSNIAAEAQYFLGTVHSRGIYNVQRDDSKAFSYYQQASKAQHAEANYRTAVCYEVGVGTRRDPSRALQFYRKAAAQSNVPAMYKLGVILIKGLLGVSPSPREGINWLKRGADNATPECPHALHELALCHESSEIPGVIPDETYSRQLYIKAGKLGYVPSQVRLGQAYEYGSLGCPVDPRRSIGWYTRAAEKNDGDAELALSGWYLTGAEPHLPQNDVEAFLWARRAADHGSAKAMYAVGYYYECGIGVAHPDVNEAHKWYTMAAKKQNRRAMARLQELKQMGVNVVPLSKAPRPKRGKGSIF
ncbi:hypothetical protein IWW36_003677 [Coemansia brasiliensis]|uniref:HCP-like protein n=1 Tax=Coemansia brasiliensis TaxID=2650707 RepID=A0A9W8LYQ8_9FUNG|nr:hypothetical protein IWW36_003677 [Coemansia brasiliensis]